MKGSLKFHKMHVLILESSECKNTGQKNWGRSENPAPLKSVRDDKSRGTFPLILWDGMPYCLLD